MAGVALLSFDTRILAAQQQLSSWTDYRLSPTEQLQDAATSLFSGADGESTSTF